MKRSELPDLHYITPIDNLLSIAKHGLLSHNAANKLAKKPDSIAMQEVQDLRAGKRVPGGLLVHDYVNLYICARNPMMFKRRAMHAEICVLSVSPEVLDLAGVVVTDQNAASKYVRFAGAPSGLSIVDAAMTFARDWTHPLDQIAEWRHTSRKCAEVLVPKTVAFNFIEKIYVSGAKGEGNVQALGVQLDIDRLPDMFFQA